jgi:hypothetical protein
MMRVGPLPKYCVNSGRTCIPHAEDIMKYLDFEMKNV